MKRDKKKSVPAKYDQRTKNGKQLKKLRADCYTREANWHDYRKHLLISVSYDQTSTGLPHHHLQMRATRTQILPLQPSLAYSAPPPHRRKQITALQDRPAVHSWSLRQPMTTPSLLLRQPIATEEAGEKAATAGRPFPIQNILFTFTEYCKEVLIVLISKINFKCTKTARWLL